MYGTMRDAEGMRLRVRKALVAALLRSDPGALVTDVPGDLNIIDGLFDLDAVADDVIAAMRECGEEG